MIRMVEVSVRFGIKSRGNRELGTKKRRSCRPPLKQERQPTPRARVVFRPDSAAAKGPDGPHQPAFFTHSLYELRRGKGWFAIERLYRGPPSHFVLRRGKPARPAEAAKPSLRCSSYGGARQRRL